jgi:long-chain acyl-CoA synthetase
VTRATLLDFFHDISARTATFLVHDDGYRTWTYSYAEIGHAAHVLAARLHEAGIRKGDPVLLWAENRPEWIVAFWACLLRGAVVVPVDYRSPASFVTRVRTVVGATLLLAGDEVEHDGLPADLRRWRVVDTVREAHGQPVTPLPPVEISRDDMAEIIFTSGATAEPKGVIITHRNVLANIVPIEREMQKYLRYARPFAPIRFLNLLPLSHMFGQAMATFVPPMLTGTVVFMNGYAPAEIVRQIRSRRISVLVSVPKILDVLREHVSHVFPETTQPPPEGTKWYRRWWRYRRVHRAFGWKFWAAVVGAAPLDPELEAFWGRLGFLVVQGYGLTETAPIVTLNHPLSARRGSVGKPIHGVEVKIAPDGEVLVRGENVSQGYVGGGPDAGRAFDGGWLHTGDIGTLDEQGRLTIKGRKKEMIVTPEGLNVFPEDIERALLDLQGVRDAAVVGRQWNGEERVHAVLLLEAGRTVDDVVAEANATLADHQRIRSASVWPGAALPRTAGTRKLQRRKVKEWVDSGEAEAMPEALAGDPLLATVARFAHGRTHLDDTTSLEALGLSSLEHVELLMALEQQFETTVDEMAFAMAHTIGDLRPLVGQGVSAGSAPDGSATGVAAAAMETDARREADGAERPSVARSESRELAGSESRPYQELVFPKWNRAPWAYWLRRASLATWILPLARVFVRLRVSGLEHLQGLDGPVVFAANHQSHIDTPAVLMALPARWRYRTTVAMAKEFFKAHFFPAQHGMGARLTNSTNYYLASLFFNAFPLPQREAGTRQTLRYIGALLEEGQSLLIFPEGKRTLAGEINPFRAGIGMIGARLGVPVVPVRIGGADRVLHQHATMATPGRVTVTFGPPLRLEGDDYAALAAQVEAAVRALPGPDAGAAVPEGGLQ